MIGKYCSAMLAKEMPYLSILEEEAQFSLMRVPTPICCGAVSQLQKSIPFPWLLSLTVMLITILE